MEQESSRWLAGADSDEGTSRLLLPLCEGARARTIADPAGLAGIQPERVGEAIRYRPTGGLSSGRPDPVPACGRYALPGTTRRSPPRFACRLRAGG